MLQAGRRGWWAAPRDRPGPGLDGLAEDLEDLVHAVGEQVLVEDLAHGQVALAGTEPGLLIRCRTLL